jgi:hypothetical protein
MQALKKEEGQWRWKRHKEGRQLDVETENLKAKKWNVQVQVNKINRRHMTLTKGTRTLERKKAALGTATAKVLPDKKVQPPCPLVFYSLAFPVLILHLSLCAFLRHFYVEALS